MSMISGEAAVLAGEPHRAAAVAVDEIDNLLVHETAQHHLDHVQGLRVGHTHALHEFTLLADARKQLADLRSAARHHHEKETDEFHEHHVTSEATQEKHVGHG